MWGKGPLSIDRARSIRTLAAMGSPPGGEYSLAGKDSARGQNGAAGNRTVLGSVTIDGHRHSRQQRGARAGTPPGPPAGPAPAPGRVRPNRSGIRRRPGRGRTGGTSARRLRGAGRAGRRPGQDPGPGRGRAAAGGAEGADPRQRPGPPDRGQPQPGGGKTERDRAAVRRSAPVRGRKRTPHGAPGRRRRPGTQGTGIRRMA
jgi:hypothetical protein